MGLGGVESHCYDIEASLREHCMAYASDPSTVHIPRDH
jgi:hypothetical protein